MQLSSIALFILTAQCLGLVLGMPHVKDIPKNKVSPRQHRLAYAGLTGMTVSWNTYQHIQKPTVFYGKSPKRLNKIATSHESVTYQTSLTYNNHVKIEGLQPGTTYYYRVLHDKSSEIYSFTTAKEAGSEDEFSFGLVIDMGTMGNLGLSDTTGEGAGGALTPGEQTTMQSLAQNVNHFDFLLHPGDLAYADYWLKEEVQEYLPLDISKGYQVYEQILNAFYDEIQPVTSKRPYMVGPGNHEADCDNGGTTDKINNVTYTNSICMPGQTNFTGFKNHFRMPSAESGGRDNFWYSFDYGLVHFVQYNTETDFGNGLKGPEDGGINGPLGSYENEQIDWLEKDLSSVNRTKTPWVIALGHRPWYVAAKKSDRCTTCQEAFEDILTKNNVDLVLAGHVHNYERLSPVANNEVDPNGLNNPSAPWYILNGIAGHYDGLDSLVYPLPDYVEYSQDTAYGWSKFTVHNRTHLTHEFVVSSNNTVLDTATLYKSH
ncbi:uncharacterized protein PRCAT00005024001 [Priceomyces carsonii]|uniref:uncharacterized protein n=1 Tax=Priceomyces carsonii TaxID=28549 RepID=UPI002ED7ECFC|nr:unnamed protein product [Priceomyces carsonii]